MRQRLNLVTLGVTDLDGHRWEIAHNPGFSVDDDGRVRIAVVE